MSEMTANNGEGTSQRRPYYDMLSAVEMSASLREIGARRIALEYSILQQSIATGEPPHKIASRLA